MAQPQQASVHQRGPVPKSKGVGPKSVRVCRSSAELGMAIMHPWHWLGKLRAQQNPGMDPQEEKKKVLGDGTWARKGIS